ncbi:hypothetical protein K438DRAFT_1986220 [Mycena galopus ATCC 62051]|nr:hypothetical protein K438DRAFT_1986220 [Mycena galopus ATCC 62051]
MSPSFEGNLSDLYVELKYELCAASAALFFNGICLLLFGFAVFFLRKMKTQTSRMFLPLSLILVMFAVVQVCLDVACAATFLRVTEILVDGGLPAEVLPVYQTYARLSISRAALIGVNKQVHPHPSASTLFISFFLLSAITDGLLLYRCTIIWRSSPYARVVFALPLFLILSTLAVGLWAAFWNTTETPAPFALALATNFVLLCLTAGRIWKKGKNAMGHRYSKTLEMICESSLLYFVNVLVYLISSVTQPISPLTGVAWGALAQVVNIVPMMIIVRVGMARSSDESEVSSRPLHGSHANSFRMAEPPVVATPLKASGPYSEI